MLNFKKTGIRMTKKKLIRMPGVFLSDTPIKQCAEQCIVKSSSRCVHIQSYIDEERKFI